MHSLLQKILLTGLLACVALPAHANNLTISNVNFGTRDPGNKTLVVSFDAAWENSWRTKINHDAVWLTIRLNNTAVTPTNKKLCQVSQAGINPLGTSVGSNAGLELYVPQDKLGLFLQRANNATIGNVSTTGISVSINYGTCGFTDTDQVNASVLGLEMVFIPQGSFYAGDNGTSTASLDRGTADSRPWNITSEAQINVTNAAGNSYRYVSNSLPNEYATGTTFNIPQAFPKGYNAFYTMKYEINEGQWVEFINSLPTDAMRSAHDLTDNAHKGTDNVLARNTISCAGAPLTCSTTRPGRPVTYLNWSDLTAFLDWVALRPMTELEFEKMARGPVLPNNGEFAWGTTEINAASTISGNEDGTEFITTLSANANFGNTALSGGDAVNGAENANGALRSGIFATSNATRQTSGGSYYGVMDLSGNVSEAVVTIGNAAGIAFTGLHGDGNLSTDSGFEGNAMIANWPGLDTVTTHGITSASGSGFRGGSWADNANQLRISDRSQAALAKSTASNNAGGRGVRTYDGN